MSRRRCLISRCGFLSIIRRRRAAWTLVVGVSKSGVLKGVATWRGISPIINGLVRVGIWAAPSWVLSCRGTLSRPSCRPISRGVCCRGIGCWRSNGWFSWGISAQGSRILAIVLVGLRGRPISIRRWGSVSRRVSGPCGAIWTVRAWKVTARSLSQG